MSGATPRALIGEQFAGAADAGLHFVEDQQQAALVAELAQRSQKFRRHHAHAALAHHRLDDDAGGRIGDRALDGIEIAERHLVEAFHDRPEAFEIFFLAAGGERRERAPVERALEGHEPDALRMPAHRMIFARHLDRAFHRLGAGIAEEHGVGEACRAQPGGETLGLRNAVKVRDVPELLRLLGHRGDKRRVGMAEHIDRDAGGEVEVARAVGRRQPRAFAPLEGEVGTRIGRQKMRSHSQTSRGRQSQPVMFEMKCAAFSGRHEIHSISGLITVNHARKGKSMPWTSKDTKKNW